MGMTLVHQFEKKERSAIKKQQLFHEYEYLMLVRDKTRKQWIRYARLKKWLGIPTIPAGPDGTRDVRV